MTDYSELKEKFYELVLKKSVSLELNEINCYLELSCEGKDLQLIALLYESEQNFSDELLEQVELLMAKGLVIDPVKRQILLLRKHDFSSMSPDMFAIRIIQFFSEIQEYRKDIDGFRENEFAYIPKK